MTTSPQNNAASAGEELLRAGAQTTVERQLKARLASLFNRDANDFLWRADMASESEFQHRAWLGKIYVDYVMAIECALKASIIHLSPDSESPEEAYKAARTQSHHIAKLLQCTRVRTSPGGATVSPLCVAFLTGLPFSVSARYDLELLHAHFSTKKGYGSKINDSIRNQNFMNNLKLYAFEIRDFALSVSKTSVNRNLPIKATLDLEVQEKFSKFKLS